MLQCDSGRSLARLLCRVRPGTRSSTSSGIPVPTIFLFSKLSAIGPDSRRDCRPARQPAGELSRETVLPQVFARRFAHFLRGGLPDFSDRRGNAGGRSASMSFMLTIFCRADPQSEFVNGARFSRTNDRSHRSECAGNSASTGGNCSNGPRRRWGILFRLPAVSS